MTIQAIATTPQVAAQGHIEDSDFCKVVCSIPLIGDVFSIARELNIHHTISGTNDASKLIQLIDLKNNQQQENINRRLLTTALIVTGIAMRTIPESYIWGPAICVACILVESSMIRHNADVKRALQQSGNSRLRTQIW